MGDPTSLIAGSDCLSSMDRILQSLDCSVEEFRRHDDGASTNPTRGEFDRGALSFGDVIALTAAELRQSN